MPLSCRSIGGTQVLVFIFNHKIRPTLRGRSWQIVSFRSLYIIRPYQMLSWPEEVGSDVLPYTRKRSESVSPILSEENYSLTWVIKRLITCLLEEHTFYK